MQSAVIYLFVSPSGRAYAGKHACDHTEFPRRGMGPLPSGYKGSGKLWRNVNRKYGPAIRWIILKRFTDAARADIDAAERRAIRLVRTLWADRCVNVHEGGDGLTSADAVAIWSRPGTKVKKSAAMKKLYSSPIAREKTSAAMKAACAHPGVMTRLKVSASSWAKTPDGKAHLTRARDLANTSEAKSRHSAKLRAWANSPEGKAHLDRARAARSFRNV